MQLNSTGLQSHTFRNGSVLYYGGGSAISDDGTKGAARGAFALDKGGDGTIDAAGRGRIAAGPNGVAASGTAIGQNGAIHGRGALGADGSSAAKVAATNYETAKVWKRFS